MVANEGILVAVVPSVAVGEDMRPEKGVAMRGLGCRGAQRCCE